MKICDRHFQIDGKPVKAVSEVIFSKIHESYDLCQSCNELVREFINNPQAVLVNHALKEKEPAYVAKLEALPEFKKESFKCEICPFEGKSEQGLKVHMKAKHS